MRVSKRFISALSLFAAGIIVLAGLGLTVQTARAQDDCEVEYTVQGGDYLAQIARNFDMTVTRILELNPDIDNPNLIFPGQVLCLEGDEIPPTGPGNTRDYIALGNETLNTLATLFDTGVQSLVDLNPGTEAGEELAEGQRLTVPIRVDLPGDVDLTSYIIQRGDYLSRIADRFDTSVPVLLELNPSIEDPSLVFPGARIVVPADGTELPPTGGDDDGDDGQDGDTYLVRSGDTLSGIAVVFDTTVEELLDLNPEIEDRNLIYVGQRIRVP